MSEWWILIGLAAAILVLLAPLVYLEHRWYVADLRRERRSQ